MRNYWWLKVTRDVREYIDRCNICQRMKNRIEALVRKLKLSEILEKLWMYLIVDFIIKLPLVVRKDTILVVCDKLNKMLEIEIRLSIVFYSQTDGQTKQIN